MMTEPGPPRDWFELRTVDAHDLRPDGPLAGATDDLYANRLHGVRVRGLFDSVAMAEAIVRLEASALPRYPIFSHTDAAFSFGAMIAPTGIDPRGPDPETYFAAADVFRPALARVLAPLDVESRLAGALSALAGGRPAGVPRCDGRSYAAATVRVFPDGFEVPLHCDTYAPSPTHAHLHAVTDRRVQPSYYVPMSLPDEGGVLVVYNAVQGESGPSDDDAGSRASRQIAPRRAAPFRRPIPASRSLSILGVFLRRLALASTGSPTQRSVRTLWGRSCASGLRSPFPSTSAISSTSTPAATTTARPQSEVACLAARWAGSPRSPAITKGSISGAEHWI